ncbi:type II secretion system protein [Rariglobus hedericola]|uniref:Type II secretion system protein n=1 Tax=Rariglobus hedericola TaxID=2597822 RepID=A0A556QSD2_9BACT|nr:type II secretion system protein [Rariglobus hedericola]TSJ79533.1 type II secretion system protein [Rariglobus hedericola]
MKYPCSRIKCRRPVVATRGFTLIELLAVICIITILAALVLPLLGRMQAKAKATTCTSNLRQMGASFRLYAADNQGFLPAVSKNTNADPAKGSLNTLGHWQVEISPYSARTFTQNIQGAKNANDLYVQCPEFTVTDANVVSRGYGMNDLLTSRGMVKALTTSSNSSNYSYNFRVRVAEVVEPSRTLLVVDSDSAVASLAPRHFERGHCVFVDGHVAAHTVTEATALKSDAIKY